MTTTHLFVVVNIIVLIVQITEINTQGNKQIAAATTKYSALNVLKL